MYIRKFNEAKNIGMLYHFTSLLSLYSIVRYDEMISQRSMEGLVNYAKITNLNQDYIHKYYISFTRNKNFTKPEFSSNIDSVLSCRIDFDGNKLSNKYSIKPVSFYSNRGKTNKDSFEGSDESEEIIIINSDVLPDVIRYIDNINICDSEYFYNEMLVVLEEEFNVDQTFNFIKNVIGVNSEVIDTIVDDSDLASDLFTREVSDLIYDKIVEFLSTKFPNYKIFKSEQHKLLF